MTFVYSAEELRALRPSTCACVSRTVARRLKYFHIYTRHIPVITSSRRDSSSKNSRFGSSSYRQRCLTKVKLECSRAPSNAPPRIPSFLLSNVRSIRNKFDEINIKLSELSPGIAVFCESWLSDDIPDEAVSIPTYAAYRKDRDCSGGGIIVYVSQILKSMVVDSASVPSLEFFPGDILPLVIPECFLLVITLYHPFWNNKSKHEDAIKCLTDVVDFCLSRCLDPLKAKIVICGDFNDLRMYANEISRLMNLHQIVDFPTRAENTLDLIFTNFSHDYSPNRHPPIGKSDHVCVLVPVKCQDRFCYKKTYSENFEIFHYFFSQFC